MLATHGGAFLGSGSYNCRTLTAVGSAALRPTLEDATAAGIADDAARARYLCACLTMGLDVLVPLFKASVSSSKCLATAASFSPDADLRRFFAAFVAHIVHNCPLPSTTGDACTSDDYREMGLRLRGHAAAVDAALAAFLNSSGRQRSLFDANVYPPLATGVVRPLDALRRSMQPIPLAQAKQKATTSHQTGEHYQHQLFISGRPAAAQPIACLAHGITHVVRCYAVPPGGEPFATRVVASGAAAAARRRESLRRPQSTPETQHFGSSFASPLYSTGQSPLCAAGDGEAAALPADSELVAAALEKGGEWVVVPPAASVIASCSPTGSSTAALTSSSLGANSPSSSFVGSPHAASYRIDRLEFPVGMLRGQLRGYLGEAAANGEGLNEGSGGDDADAVYAVQRLTIPAVDDDAYPIDQHFNNTVFGFISTAIASGGRVLIHCAAGKHRSAAVAAAYLIDLQVPEGVGVGRRYGSALPPSPQAVVERCFTVLRAARPMAEPTPNYQRRLETFAARVLAGLAGPPRRSSPSPSTPLLLGEPAGAKEVETTDAQADGGAADSDNVPSIGDEMAGAATLSNV